MNKGLEALQKVKTKMYSNEQDHVDEVKVKEIYDKIAANLLKLQKEAFEAELKSIRDMKSTRGRAAAIFQTKDKVVGIRLLLLKQLCSQILRQS